MLDTNRALNAASGTRPVRDFARPLSISRMNGWPSTMSFSLNQTDTPSATKGWVQGHRVSAASRSRAVAMGQPNAWASSTGVVSIMVSTNRAVA